LQKKQEERMRNCLNRKISIKCIIKECNNRKRSLILILRN
jgi:hypothetical protein